MKSFELNGRTWEFDPRIRWLYSPGGKVTFMLRSYADKWQAVEWSDDMLEEEKAAILEKLNGLNY